VEDAEVTKPSFPLGEATGAAKAGRVTWRAHVLRRMVERGFCRAEIIEALEHGEVIEDYADDTPYPSALVLGFRDELPLHVVVAFDASAPETYIITVYEPSPDKFESDWRTRRRTP